MVVLKYQISLLRAGTVLSVGHTMCIVTIVKNTTLEKFWSAGHTMCIVTIVKSTKLK